MWQRLAALVLLFIVGVLSIVARRFRLFGWGLSAIVGC
jgi:hypothetical protein